MKYLLFLLSTFAVAFGCSSQARQAESASNADSAVVADVADSEYTDISKLRITPIGRYRSYTLCSTECQGLPLRAIWLIR